MYVWIVNQIFSQQQTKNRKNGFSRLVRKNGFSRLVRKNKKKKTKNKKVRNLSEEGNVHSLDKNPLTSKVKVRFEPGSWSDGSAATKARSQAGSWNADGGDEIRRT